MAERKRILLLCASTRSPLSRLDRPDGPRPTITIPESPPPSQTPEIIDAPVADVPPVKRIADPETRSPRRSLRSPGISAKPSGNRPHHARNANLSLLYFDPQQTYLTPYIARAFENALPFERKLFNWTPWERTTVRLKDFSD